MQLLKNTKKPIETGPNKDLLLKGFYHLLKAVLRDTTGSIICFCFLLKKKEGRKCFI